MDTATRQAYDAVRDLSNKGFGAACYAPFTSLYLDPHGDVLACCQNTEHLLGNIGEESLLDIWHGPRLAELRTALGDYDLGLGCRFCAWQVEDGNHRTVYARSFETLAADRPDPAWPRRLELALSNTCNLECVMCDGEWSSKIRSRREGRAPLPKVYGDRFFTELAAFLPHLDEIRFLGGEPFLAAESLRVMDMLVDARLAVPCNVTTNGTQWNPRVERILATLPVSVAVSLDGVTAETVEAIRVGADHPTLMANLARYRDATRAQGTELALTFCLMQANWREFAAYLRLGDEWGCRVHVNTVIDAAHSLFHLPAGELSAVVDELERQGDGIGRSSPNRAVWDEELDRLRSWRDRAGGTPVDPPGPRPSAVYFEDQEVAPLPRALRSATNGPVSPETAWEHAVAGMDEPARAQLRCDGEDVVLEVVGTDDLFIGLAAERCVGRSFVEVATALGEVNGNRVRTLKDVVVDGGALRQVIWRDPSGRATYAQVFSYPEHDGNGYAGSATVAAWSTTAPTWAPAPGR